MLAWAEDESRTWQLMMGNHSPGLPSYKPSLDTSLAAACWSLADKWVFWDQHAVSDCVIDISNQHYQQECRSAAVQEFLRLDGSLVGGRSGAQPLLPREYGPAALHQASLKGPGALASEETCGCQVFQ